jgi:CBS-domain-containing membrane protein
MQATLGDHVKRLPVVDQWGVLAGVVSRADLLKVFLPPDEEIAEEVRREVVVYLFGDQAPGVVVKVADGVVTLTSPLPDSTLVPVAARLARAVEGVVDVQWDDTGQTLVAR